MDLASVPEIGSSFARKLQDAGCENAEALVVWEDIGALAERSGIDHERLESFRDAARARVERVLADVGVTSPEQLATADPAELSERTGLSIAYLDRYRHAAQHAVDGPGAKVVLVDGAPVARVHLAGATHHAVPLLTAGVFDEDDAVLARAGGDAVLLKVDRDAVPALIGGITHRDLPLYKERRKDGGEIEEIRVRVTQIRDVPVAGESAKEEKKGGLGRLFSRKKQ